MGSKVAAMNKSYEWAEFSSDSSDDELATTSSTSKPWNKKENNQKDKNKNGNINKGKSDYKIPKKKKANNVKTFGAKAHHKHKGKLFVPTPIGKPMVLSRRLSRRIMKASPLRSPIVACTLNFNSSSKKTTAVAVKKKVAKKGSRPPRA